MIKLGFPVFSDLRQQEVGMKAAALKPKREIYFGFKALKQKSKVGF